MKSLRCLLALACLSLPVLAFAQTEKEDEALIEAMSLRIRELQLQAQATSDDLVRYTELQEEVMALMRSTLAKVSPKARPALEIGLTLMGPLQEESNAYLKLAATRIESGIFDFTTVRTPDELEQRIEQLRDLRERNERLRDRINRLDDEVKRILSASPLSKAEQRAFREGFNQEFGKRVGPMKAVRTLDTQLFDQFVIGFQHLKKHWGAWTAAEDGPLSWTDEAAQSKFEQIVAEIQVLAERQAEAERLFAERL